MSYKHYIIRVLFPIIVVFLFYVLSLFISGNDSKDRALFLIIIGHCYGIALCSFCWLLFKLIGPIVSESLKRNIITALFVATGFYFIMTADDKETIIASMLYIAANFCAILLSRKFL